MESKMGKVERIVKLGSGVAQILLLVLLVILFACNFNQISRSIGRLQRLVVPGMLEVTMLDIRAPQNGPSGLKWATYYRVSEVEVVDAKLDDDPDSEECKSDPKNAEWLELMAPTFPVQLAGGYIGDSNELWQISEEAPVLKVGECIRIVTYGNAQTMPEDECKTVEATPLKKDEKPGGFLKKDCGEGDRIVVFDRKKRSVLDMDYWNVAEANCCARALERQEIPCSSAEK